MPRSLPGVARSGEAAWKAICSRNFGLFGLPVGAAGAALHRSTDPPPMGRVWHSDGVGRLCSRLLLCRCRRLWMDMDLGFLMQRQTAIPIVGRSFVLLRGIRLCIFVPGKTLFFEEKFYRFSDYLCKSPQMLERLVISSISGILRFGRYPAYHGISEPHLALKSSKTVVETAAYYRPCWSATK